MLIVSCAKEQPESERLIPLNVSISFETKAGGSSDETVQPVVNSVRVLGFDANDADKPCVLNEFFPFGYTVMKAGPAYRVQMSSPITINSLSTLYDFYVVLNEGDYSLVGQADGKTVSDLLTNIVPVTSVESDFTDIYATLAKNDKTEISGNPVGEPAFLMCAKSLGFPISVAEQKLPDAKDLQFIVSGGRTMAQIVIEKITSAPMDGYATNDAAVPLVFVKSVSLENVPSTIDWDEPATTATGATPMASIPVGEAVTDSNGVYYNRVWPGFLTTVLNVNASMTQTTDARLYKEEVKDSNKWFFPELENKNAGNYDKYNTDDVKKQAIQAYNYKIEPDQFKLVFSKKVDGKDLFTKEEENIKSYYSVTEVTTPISSSISGTNLKYTDDIWTVNLGERYYVPENITSNAGDATYIKVVLAVAAPSLNLSAIGDSLSWWPTPGNMTVTSDYSYYLPCSATLDTSEEFELNSFPAGDTGKAKAKDLGRENMHIVYSDDIDTDLPWTDPTFTPVSGKKFNVYVDGFYRKATGTSTITVNQNQKGGDFNWNIPPTSTLEFHIPISQSGGKYDVVRNTRYKVTLHVNKDPRNPAPASASASSSPASTGVSYATKGGSGLGITAIVETEKINDYED